jgi:tRNA(Ile)-lysidine synthase
VPVIIDHQLQVGSDRVAQNALAACTALGLSESEVRVVDVTHSGDGVESAARNARYAALREAVVTHDAVGIVVAHSLEDQAETVLMRLSRGSGTRSLSGMSVDKDGIWRPLLTVKRADLRLSLEDYGVEIFDDPHNVDRRFTRVRVRHDVMPVLREALGASVDEALARTAQLSFDDAQALDLWADRVLKDATDGQTLIIEVLKTQPKAVMSRVVKAWLEANGAGLGSLTYEHISAVTRLIVDPRVRPSVRVAGGVEVVRESGRLRA